MEKKNQKEKFETKKNQKRKIIKEVKPVEK